ncbi:hypothetical protein H4R20_001102 [Coemansia guatemalensis]|uniref:SCP domain-containing protein n=1 Tax=Coemansia guatemalensis TaxID=2761395 RepID=A0A9W8LV84_9FUNG|nr:hypothetical protein H4R20_002404 [Coemansia guatemalensis]KAJ2807865.1 hypothetical protein H4R20_001102 [Coemansia guatemalensis]
MKFIVAVIALASIASAIEAPRTAGQDICCAANLDRAAKGLKPYKWTPELDYIATKHSEYMLSVDAISHDEKAGTSTYQLADRMKTVSFEFSTAGENVANGFDDLWATEKAWMESPGHKANIMSETFTVCGGGVADPGRFFTTNFASPLDVEDDSKYYTLRCSNGVSSGAYTSNPEAHAAMMGESSVTPLSELGKEPVPSAAKPETESVAETSAEEVVVTTSPAEEENAASPVEETSAEPAPVSEETTAEAAPVPAPAPAPTTPSAGKCKRVPKGSIAAGKCKPCKKCSANSSPFRR